MSSLPKPVLRGHVIRRGVKCIVGSLLFGGIVSGSYYFFVAVPRKNAYINFMKTYDGEAHYKDMVTWGYIQNSSKKKKEAA